MKKNFQIPSLIRMSLRVFFHAVIFVFVNSYGLQFALTVFLADILKPRLFIMVNTFILSDFIYFDFQNK